MFCSIYLIPKLFVLFCIAFCICVGWCVDFWVTSTKIKQRTSELVWLHLKWLKSHVLSHYSFFSFLSFSSSFSSFSASSSHSHPQNQKMFYVYCKSQPLLQFLFQLSQNYCTELRKEKNVNVFAFWSRNEERVLVRTSFSLRSWRLIQILLFIIFCTFLIHGMILRQRNSEPQIIVALPETESSLYERRFQFFYTEKHRFQVSTYLTTLWCGFLQLLVQWEQFCVLHILFLSL